MQTKKMSIATIQGKLSRAEMKNIMAGSGENECSQLSQSQCGPHVACAGSMNNGKCGWTAAWGRCTCGTAS